MNNTKIQKYRQIFFWRILLLICGLSFGLPNNVLAHQTPTTNIILNITPSAVSVELQIPISELELAFGTHLSQNPQLILQQNEPQLKEYILSHIKAYKNKNEPWSIEINSMQLDSAVLELQKIPNWELIVQLKIIPFKRADTRNFVLDYDVVMHQVVNHTALVSIRNDWENGITESNIEVGTIIRDISNDIIPPFKNLLRLKSLKVQ